MCLEHSALYSQSRPFNKSSTGNLLRTVQISSATSSTRHICAHPIQRIGEGKGTHQLAAADKDVHTVAAGAGRHIGAWLGHTAAVAGDTAGAAALGCRTRQASSAVGACQACMHMQTWIPVHVSHMRAWPMQGHRSQKTGLSKMMLVRQHTSCCSDDTSMLAEAGMISLGHTSATLQL